MESQLRLLMVRGGLPRPEPQVSIYDRHGVFVARLDLFYRAANLGVEYDGSAHRDSLAADARRLNRLLRAGVSVLRYTAGDVYNRPHEVVEEVRAELAARKHPGICVLGNPRDQSSSIEPPLDLLKELVAGRTGVSSAL